MYSNFWPGEFGTGSTLYALALYFSHAVNLSVQTTVHVAVELSPATAAAASIGSTPSWGVILNRDIISVSFGS